MVLPHFSHSVRVCFVTTEYLGNLPSDGLGFRIQCCMSWRHGLLMRGVMPQKMNSAPCTLHPAPCTMHHAPGISNRGPQTTYTRTRTTTSKPEDQKPRVPNTSSQNLDPESSDLWQSLGKLVGCHSLLMPHRVVHLCFRVVHHQF